MKLNNCIKNIPVSNIHNFNQFLSRIDKINLLTYGESSFPINDFIKSKLIDSILSDNNKYLKDSEINSSKECIINFENKKLSSNYNTNNILLCNGSSEALFLVLSTIINQNDEVILIAPFFPLYEQVCTYLKAKIKIYTPQDYQINIKELKNLISSSTKAIIINSPNNPNGQIINQSILDSILFLASKYHLYLVCDFVYDQLCYQPMQYFSNINNHIDNLLIVNSFSKSLSMTGLRIGYLIGPDEIISQATKFKQMINIAPTSFIVKSIPYFINQKFSLSFYKKNLKFLINFFNKLKIKYYIPQGGFYLFFDISLTKLTSLDFCTRLANEYKIGLIPGSFFHQEYYVRLSFSGDYLKLKKGLKSIKKAILAMAK